MSGSATVPVISVVTACLNCAATLENTISSVVGQQGVTVRHLIIDGGSSDGSLDIIRSSKSSTIFLSEPDNGIYDAMNKGISLADGDVIGFLNGDDFYASPAVLAKVAQVFRDDRVEACYGDLCYVNGTDCWKVVRYWRSGSFSYRKMYWGWMPPHPTFFARRRVYEEYGRFNLELGSAADYELMLRMLVKYRVNAVYLPEILVCMRTGGVSNASVANRFRANQMDRKAWKVNGLSPYPWTLWCKPLRKLPQYWQRPEVSLTDLNWMRAE